MNRTGYVGPGHGSTLLQVMAFVMEHGTQTDAVLVCRWLHANKEHWSANRHRATNLDVYANPGVATVKDYDIERACAVLLNSTTMPKETFGE